MSPSYFVNPLTDSISKIAPSIDEEIMNLMNSSIDLKKPMEIFDEPMLLTPPAPPPLDDHEMFSFGDVSCKNISIKTNVNEKMNFSPSSLVSNDFLDNNDLFDCNLFDNNENQSDTDNNYLWSE